MATYRGLNVDHSVFNRKSDTYSLIGDNGETVVELKRHEYMAHPQLRTLEQRSGRHRGANQKNNRGANRVASGAGGIDPSTLYTWYPSPPAGRGKGAGLGSWVFFDRDEKPKPPLRRDGIVAGEIVGYRCWRVERGLLRSVYQSDVWKPGEVLEGRELGDWDSRGIHAWKDAGSQQYHDYIRAYLNDQSDPFRRLIFFGSGTNAERAEQRPAMVTGTVFLWGDVVEHERGYRAEYARVRSLDWLYPDAGMMGREQQALDELRRRYIRAAVGRSPEENNPIQKER
jgi:hypothetical protein